MYLEIFLPTQKGSVRERSLSLPPVQVLGCSFFLGVSVVCFNAGAHWPGSGSGTPEDISPESVSPPTQGSEDRWTERLLLGCQLPTESSHCPLKDSHLKKFS